MKLSVPIIFAALIPFSASTQATIIQFDFEGVFTSTSDTTGAVFGVGSNTGVGQSIVASLTFDTSTFGVDHLFQPPGSNVTHMFESDRINHQPWNLPGHSAEDNVSGSFAIGGATNPINLNVAFYNQLTYADNISFQGNDSAGVTSNHVGLYQLSPTAADGTFDYLSVVNGLSFNIFDTTGGLLNGVDFSQPIEWTSNGNSTGKGRFFLTQDLFAGGNGNYNSGTHQQTLTDASGEFILTRFKAREVNVPESPSLNLLGAGLLMTALCQWRRGRRQLREEPSVEC